MTSSVVPLSCPANFESHDRTVGISSAILRWSSVIGRRPSVVGRPITRWSTSDALPPQRQGSRALSRSQAKAATTCPRLVVVEPAAHAGTRSSYATDSLPVPGNLGPTWRMAGARGQSQISMMRDDAPGEEIGSLREELLRYRSSIKQLKVGHRCGPATSSGPGGKLVCLASWALVDRCLGYV